NLVSIQGAGFESLKVPIKPVGRKVRATSTRRAITVVLLLSAQALSCLVRATNRPAASKSASCGIKLGAPPRISSPASPDKRTRFPFVAIHLPSCWTDSELTPLETGVSSAQ